MYREPRANLNQKLESNLPKVCGHESSFNLSSISAVANLDEGKGEHQGRMKKTFVGGISLWKGEGMETPGRLIRRERNREGL